MRELIFNWIKSFYNIDKAVPIEELLNHPEYLSDKYLWMLAMIGALIVLFAIAWYLTRMILLAVIKVATIRTKSKFDDLLVEKKVLKSLSHILPLLLLDYFFAITFISFPGILEFSLRLNDLLIVLVILISIRRFLNAVQEVLAENPYFKDKPIGAYVQTVKLIVNIIFIIVMLSVVTGKSPLVFLTSL